MTLYQESEGNEIKGATYIVSFETTKLFILRVDIFVHAGFRHCVCRNLANAL